MVPLPVPEGVTVHQVWLLAAVHDELEVTVKLVDPAGVAGTFWLGGVTDSVGGAFAAVKVPDIKAAPCIAQK